MAQPKKYQRTKDFSVNSGSATDHPAINSELDAVALTTDQIRASLAKIQSDDGRLKLIEGTATQFLELAAPTGAGLVGTSSGDTVEAAINAQHLTDYAALRAYAGNQKSAYVTGYLVTAAPSGIAGLFTRDDSDTTSADNGGTIIVASNGKRWKRVYEGALNVMWFGAKGDWNGTTGTDDIVAIKATIAYAKSKLADTAERYCEAEIEFPNFGNTRYLITDTIPLVDHVTYKGNGSEIYCKIAAYPRITAATAVPADSDVAGQTGGGAFTDVDCLPPSTKTQTSNVRMRDFVIRNARWGVVFLTAAVSPDIENVYCRDCDASIFFYGAIQTARLHNLESAYNTYVGIVMHATAYTANHPWKARDQMFVSSPTIFNDGHAVGVTYSADFDAWFKAAILRPASATYNSNILMPAFAYQNPDAVNPSGRFLYCPSRSSMATYSLILSGVTAIGLPRGLAYVGRSINNKFTQMSAEYFAVNAAVQALGAEVNFVELHSPSSATFDNLNTEPASPGAVYKNTVEVKGMQPWVGGIDGTSLAAMNIYGKLDPSQFDFATVKDRLNFINSATVSQSRAYPWYATTGVAVTSAGEIIVSQAPNSRSVSMYGDLRNDTFMSQRLPKASGDTQTVWKIWRDSISTTMDTSYNLNGKLNLTVVDLTTGDMDYSQYLISAAGRYANTTLAGDVAAGAISLNVTDANAGLHMHAGDQITVNAVDKYLVASVTGAAVTLATPTRAAYTSGQSVNSTFAVLRTLVAPANAWVAVAGSASSGITITNSRGTASPIKVYAHFDTIQEKNSFAK